MKRLLALTPQDLQVEKNQLIAVWIRQLASNKTTFYERRKKSATPKILAYL